MTPDELQQFIQSHLDHMGRLSPRDVAQNFAALNAMMDSWAMPAPLFPFQPSHLYYGPSPADIRASDAQFLRSLRIVPMEGE